MYIGFVPHSDFRAAISVCFVHSSPTGFCTRLRRRQQHTRHTTANTSTDSTPTPTHAHAQYGKSDVPDNLAARPVFFSSSFADAPEVELLVPVDDGDGCDTGGTVDAGDGETGNRWHAPVSSFALNVPVAQGVHDASEDALPVTNP